MYQCTQRGGVRTPDMMAASMTTAALQQLPLWNDNAIDADWRVRRSPRARRIGARIFPDGSVEIVVPAGAGARQVAGFVERYRHRIERCRQRWPRVDPVFPPERIELPALGESWRCEFRPAGMARRGRLDVMAGADSGADVAAGAGSGGVLALSRAIGNDALRAALLDWLCERARHTLGPQLAALAARLGVHYERLQIRCQRTRWGSCSAVGTISLNCCLLFHRPGVVRYLLAHELAHRTHMNHSARFWRLVEQYEPAWRVYDRELTHGWHQVPGWVLQALRA
jgi:predicted metal-dependent hydrolase